MHKLEYLWLDGCNPTQIRSKTKVVKTSNKNKDFSIPIWGFDGSSTEQTGQSGIIVFIQDGTGGRTLSLGSDYETAAAGGITLSTAADAVDIVPYFVQSAGNILLGAVQKAFA